MSERTEQTLAVLVCGVLLVAWIANPGWAFLLIGGAIGGLGVLAWAAKKIGI